MALAVSLNKGQWPAMHCAVTGGGGDGGGGKGARSGGKGGTGGDGGGSKPHRIGQSG